MEGYRGPPLTGSLLTRDPTLFILFFPGLDKFLTRYEKMSMKELLKTKRQKWTKQVP